jgi:hypothetical protein
MNLYPTRLSHDAERVLAIIKRELSGRAPTPELLADMEPLYRDALPGHSVTIQALPKLPGGKRRAKVRYALNIKGERVTGKWTFSNGWLIRYFAEVA